MDTIENNTGNTRQKKEANGQFSLFLFFIFSSPRHGTATAPQKRKQQADSQRAWTAHT
jgi:hypothetical protein